MTPEVFIPIVVAIVAPIGAYLLAARRMSGKIGTSEAADLWRESASMRNDYRSRLDSANIRIQNLESRISSLEAANIELSRENEALRHEVRRLTP